MSKHVKVDLITEDPKTDEFALYLIEEGPWDSRSLDDRLRALQDRVYDAVDLAIDGHLVSKYPQSKGRKVRIQVDCRPRSIRQVEELVVALHDHITSDPQISCMIGKNHFVSELRIVTRSQLGRV